MKVVVDARLARGAGHGTYLRNVVPRVARLRPEWSLIALGDPVVLNQPDWRASNISVVPCDASLYGIREQFEFRGLTPSDADVFWAPHYNLPWMARVPVVVTVHDLAHLRLPEYRSNPLKRAYARLMFARVRSHAAAVIFISEFTHAEFAALVGSPNGFVEVIHQGVDASWQSATPTESPEADPYFLFVGNLKPHKNLPRLLDAFTGSAVADEVSLIVIGRSEGFITAEAELRDARRVKHIERCDDAMLRRYVQHAAALIFPSLYEGFGLPPLEAMAAGVPVLASNAASIPEVCDDAALFVNPTSTDEIASAMSRILHDDALRARLVKRGRARAREFNWDLTAERTAQVLMRAARSPR